LKQNNIANLIVRGGTALKSGDEITGADGRAYTVIQRKGCRVLLGVESSEGTRFIVAHRPYPVKNNLIA